MLMNRVVSSDAATEALAFHSASDVFRERVIHSVTSHATGETGISCSRATVGVVSTHAIGIHKQIDTPSPHARNQIMYVKRGLITTLLAAALLCGGGSIRRHNPE